MEESKKQGKAQALFNQGLAYYSQKEFKTAISIFKQIDDKSSLAPLKYYYLGLCHVQLQNLEEAAKWYKKVRLIESDMLGVCNEDFIYSLYINMASVLQILKEYTDAERLYQQSLNIKDYDPRVHQNLGNIYLDQGKHEKAREMFEHVLKIAPDFDEARYCLGIVNQTEEKWDAAIEEYSQFLEKKPGSVNALNRLTVCKLQVDELEEAESYNERAMKKKPNNKKALELRNLILKKRS